MAKGKSKWLLGCGIGCGVVVLIVIVIGAGGIFFIRSTLKDFDEVIAAREQLQERFGTVSQFIPAADGAIPPERVELFLAVRDSMQVVRDCLSEAFMVLHSVDRKDEAKERSASTWSLVKTGLGVAGQMSDFFRIRNQALLDLGMGLGEYTYIYVMSYYVWLGYSPTESPENFEWDIDPNTGEYRVKSDRGDQSYEVQGTATPKRRLCQNLRSMLRNQLEALPQATDSGMDDPWGRRLAGEIEKLQNDALQLPWQDELPAPIADSLTPYRDRLVDSYSLATNILELSISRKKGWSIKAD
jgi:hypothetical protein